MIGILNLGINNLYSIKRTFQLLDCPYEIVESTQIANYEKIIIPGVGSYSKVMNYMTRSDLVSELENYASKGNYILGICLGMQLFFEYSNEGDTPSKGLGFIKGSVNKLKSTETVKVPHIGWNKDTQTNNNSSLLSNKKLDDYFYFQHSYAVNPEDKSVVVAETNHGHKFPSIIEKDNIVGVQFHPEKSFNSGMNLIDSFINL